jgi:outer membrane protein assembly factor BamB
MKAHMWGSTFVADGKVYVGDEDGDFVVMGATKEKKIISETNLGAAVYGTPIVANGTVYLQSNTHLFAFSDPTKTGAIKDEPQKLQIKLDK